MSVDARPRAITFEPLCSHPLVERSNELGARRPHVIAHHHRGHIGVLTPHHSSESGTRTPSDIGVDLVGVDAPDVVCLEDRVEISHGRDGTHRVLSHKG